MIDCFSPALKSLYFIYRAVQYGCESTLSIRGGSAGEICSLTGTTPIFHGALFAQVALL